MEGSLHEDQFVPSKPHTTSLILQTAAETKMFTGSIITITFHIQYTEAKLLRLYKTDTWKYWRRTNTVVHRENGEWTGLMIITEMWCNWCRFLLSAVFLANRFCYTVETSGGDRLTLVGVGLICFEGFCSFKGGSKRCFI